MNLHPFHLLVMAAAGWINREQQDVIEYLKEENRVLREQIGIAAPAGSRHSS